MIYLLVMLFVGAALCEPLMAKPKKRSRTKAKVHVVAKKKKKKAASVKAKAKPRPAAVEPVFDADGDEVNPFLLCEDTCDHAYGYLSAHSSLL